MTTASIGTQPPLPHSGAKQLAATRRLIFAFITFSTIVIAGFGVAVGLDAVFDYRSSLEQGRFVADDRAETFARIT